MRAIHLDAVGGVAGDMFVAAMLDALPELKPRVMADLAAVLPAEAGKAELSEGQSACFRVLRFGLAQKKAAHARHKADALATPGGGGGHRHGHGHHDDNDGGAAHDHLHDAGSFGNMVARIEAATLAEGTARQAAAILTIIAQAEAKIHGVPLSEVHFHEIADWDSLIDVVAAGSIAAALGGAQWTVSPLPRGGGLVHTQHGLLPVPAPATAMILQGFEWRDDGIAGERVTPTGAAILRHLVGTRRAPASGLLAASGTGAGTRSLPGMPNILRALVFETAEPAGADRIVVISFDIDDMTGEEIGTAADRLRALPGVLDLSIGQLWAKKGRPMQSFRLLVSPGEAEAVAESCFLETSTIGLRLHEEGRLILRREAGTAGGVRVKSAARPGGRITAKAESDDLHGPDLAARRAAKHRAEGGPHE